MEHGLLLAVQIFLAAPPTQAAVVGTVRDGTTSAPIAGAIVALTDLERSTATDSAGRYVLPEVPAGPHHVQFRGVGYAPRLLHALVPRTGTLEINVALRPEPVPFPTVDVRAPVVVRGAEGADSTSYPDRELSIAAVRNHPLLTEPDAFAVLGGGEVALRPEAPSGINIRGGASDQTAYLLDGVPVFNPYHATGVSSAWNPDALARLRLSASMPSAFEPHALSGAVEATTRAPGTRLRGQGSVSTTQARVTLDGPLGASPAGYLVSVRSGLHDVIAPRGEASYLHGGTQDWLAKLEAPAFGGHVRLLGYGNENEIGAAANRSDSPGSPSSARNLFEWDSRSFGAEWRRVFGATTVRAQGSSAAGDVASGWATPAGAIALDATRRDQSVLVAIEHRARATTLAELRFEQSRTTYSIASDSVAHAELDARMPIGTLLLQQTRPLGSRLELELGASLAAALRDAYLDPHAELRWKPSSRLTITGGYARTRQFEQSLRNSESIVSLVFPVDVAIGAGARGVPVADGDLGVIATDWRPWAGVHLGAQAYARSSRGLVLVAPRDGEPFSTGAFAIGSASARGVSVDAAASSARWGLVASYGWQRVRYEHGDSSYVPEHAAAHSLEGGVIVFPTATSSVRLGATALLGRRTTAVPDGLDWVSYNLGNQGSEFEGSPHYGDEPLGAIALPAYVRVDLGLRKHWHLEVGGRDGVLEVFGTATNLLSRRNVLTYARNLSTGQLVGIELRPASVLVAGLDWHF